MIKATVNALGMQVEGHAPRKPGDKENLICAAVSAMTQTCRDALREVGGMELSDMVEERGRISFLWDEVTDAGRIILESWALGMISLAKSYPGTIDVIYGP